MENAVINPTTQADLGLLLNFVAANPSVGFFRYQWLDFSGVLRARVLTKNYCLQLQSSARFVNLGTVSMSTLVNNTQIPGIEASGLDQLHPDWKSLRLCRYCPGHASVMCFVSRNGSQANFDRCPRTQLSRVIKEATQEQGFRILAGFEMEFLLMDDTKETPNPVDAVGGWSTSAGLRNPTVSVLEQLICTLQETGIGVQQYHTEGPRGQFEISLEPLEVMESVDALIYAREATKAICASRNVKATFLPKPLGNTYSTGAHTHISISSCETEEQFLAGILNCLPGLCAFGMSSIDSYTRVEDYKCAAGTWVSWGTENKSVPVRKIRPGYWELRFVDGAANMYLVLAATIGAGLMGLREGYELRWRDLSVFPTSLGLEGLAKLGIDRPLPRSLEQSLHALREDQHIGKILGGEMVERYATIKEVELARLGTMRPDERALLCGDFF